MKVSSSVNILLIKCQIPALRMVTRLSVTPPRPAPGGILLAHPDRPYIRERVLTSTARKHASRQLKVTPGLSCSADLSLIALRVYDSRVDREPGQY